MDVQLRVHLRAFAALRPAFACRLRLRSAAFRRLRALWRSSRACNPTALIYEERVCKSVGCLQDYAEWGLDVTDQAGTVMMVEVARHLFETAVCALQISVYLLLSDAVHKWEREDPRTDLACCTQQASCLLECLVPSLAYKAFRTKRVHEYHNSQTP